MKKILGKEEWCALPTLGIPVIKIKADSGARTSALHAFNIRYSEEDGQTFVTFDVHPIQRNNKIVRSCKAPLLDKRIVKSSSGDKERRPVIKTLIYLGDEEWEIEVTLTDRDAMGYRMLLGREAMENRFLIDPDSSFCLGVKLDSDVHENYTPHAMKGRPLRILVLASNPNLYSNQRLIEAGEKRGHHVQFVNIKHCYVNISAASSKVYYRGGEPLDHVDAVIPRIRPSATFYGCALLRQFQLTGAYCLNEASAIARARDKLRTLQNLALNGIQMPVTAMAGSPLDTTEIIKLVGGVPLIVKLLEGAQGTGVVLAETKKAAESVINAFKSLRTNLLVQEFVKEANGKDLRCFVIDGKVVGAMQRQAKDGEFRSNLHLGGVATSVKITPEERRMAIKAAKVMGLKVAGVDIIRSDTGPKVLEVNSSPGLEGIETTLNKDIAGLFYDCIEKHVW
jgi:ribosomal protein S6--L-glutamate ligase